MSHSSETEHARSLSLIVTRGGAPRAALRSPRAAIVSCLLSLFAHAVLLALFSRGQVRLRFFPIIEPVERWADPVRLVEVIRDVIPPPAETPKRSEPPPEVAFRSLDRFARRPDTSLAAPPPLKPSQLRALSEALALPPPLERGEPGGWPPHEKILLIEKPVVADSVATLPRRRIPAVARVTQTPDIILPVDRRGMKRRAVPGPGIAPSRSGEEAVRVMQVEPPMPTQSPGTKGRVAPEDAFAALRRTGEAIPDRPRAIEDYLKATVTTYHPFGDTRYGYFRIDIERRSPEALPILPKDIVFVQDASASMSEARMYFCRQALTNALTRLNPGDRFQILAFRDRVEACFANWVDAEPTAIAQGQAFVASLRSEGNTDIAQAIGRLLEMPRVASRPMIALVITDGHPTTGLMRSVDIIGEFSRANDGRLSVYTMGTVQTANEYLLDLLSYCNRGNTYIETRGRWDIPISMTRLLDSVSRPVLSDVRFHFLQGTLCEVYPVQTANLYADRPLTLYGRYPQAVTHVVFQAIGHAGDVRCDMLFDLSLQKGVGRGDRTIRKNWARQKIYHLMGQYARTHDPALPRKMHETARTYRVDIPYKKNF